jgi:hypothetical protein
MRLSTSTRRLLLWLALPGAVLCLLIVGLLWTTDDWRSPTRTLAAFCRALVARDYPTAYAHLSPAYQDRLPYETFVTTYHSADGAGAVTACQVKNTHSEFLFGTSGTVDLVYANGMSAEQTFALVTEHLFFWKISPASFAQVAGMVYYTSDQISGSFGPRQRELPAVLRTGPPGYERESQPVSRLRGDLWATACVMDTQRLSGMKFTNSRQQFSVR